MLRSVVPYDPKTALLWHNPGIDRKGAYDTAFTGFDAARVQSAAAAIRAWDGYLPAPLHVLSAAAKKLGLGALYCKDEAVRFGLGSFKVLGAPYALQRLCATHDVKTVACVSDGSHGRALAWAARRLGIGCVVYVPRGVSAARVQAIADQGARIVQIDAPYDDALIVLRREAEQEGWHIVSDFGYPGYEGVPQDCMAGYALMMDEVLQTVQTPLTHVFIQGGCGGLAAAMIAVLWMRFGAARPHVTVVEPARAASLLEAARAGQPVRIIGDLQTAMSGLAFGVVSAQAWPLLRTGVDAFMIVPEDAVAPAVEALAHPAGGDPAIAAGETGAAGFAALQQLAARPDLAAQIRLDDKSSVLIVITEGVMGSAGTAAK